MSTSLAQLSPAEFAAHQARRRSELWGLLGDLPEPKAPTGRVLTIEKHEGFTLQRLELELNGLQAVPALLLIPDKRAARAPGVLYIHWHGGNYADGKEEMLTGRPVLPAYAPVYARMGIVALAIDSWCFGQRRPYPEPADGRRGEEDTFKEMLWNGRCLFGMMMFDEWQAFRYLAGRPEVDPDRIAAFGISMGATKAMWLAALEPKLRGCIDLCCLTEYQALIADQGLSRHGIYYYVPGLLKHFEAAQINELLVPRPRLSCNGLRDGLTPPRGVEQIRNHLRPLYARFGRPEDSRIELFDCEHQELPEMRELVLQWLDRNLIQ